MEDENKIKITVELETKDAEKQADKLNDKLVDGAKDANKELGKVKQNVSKNLSDIQKQVEKSFDGTKVAKKLSDGMTKELGSIKNKINDTLSDLEVNVDAKVNSSNNNTGNINSSNLINLASDGALGSMLNRQKALINGLIKSMASELKPVLRDFSSLGNIKNSLSTTKGFAKGISGAVLETISWNKMAESVADNFDEIYELVHNVPTEIDSVSKVMRDFRKNVDIKDVMKANNMKLGEARKVASELMTTLTRMNGNDNYAQGIGTYINEIKRAEEVMQRLGKMSRGANFGEKLVPQNVLAELQSLVGVMDKATSRANIFKTQMVETALKISTEYPRISKAFSSISNGIKEVVSKAKDFKDAFKNGASATVGYISSMGSKLNEWANSHAKVTTKVKQQNDTIKNSFKNLFNEILPFASLIGLFNIIKSSITSFVDLGETENKFKQTFGSMSSDAEKWADDLSNSVAVSKTALMDASSNMMAMGKSAKLTTEDAYNMATAMSEVALDLDSFYNRTDSLDKIQSGLSGEYEALKQIGVFLNEDAVKAKALAMGLDATSNSAKMLARQELILEQVKLGGAFGDAERTVMSLSSQLKILGYRFEALRNSIGSCFQGILQVALPYVNALVSSVTNAFNKIASVINAIFGAFGIKVGGGASTGGGGGTTVQDAVGGVVDNLTSGIGGGASGAEDIADSLASGAESAKEIYRGMMGIDELNTISLPKGDKGSGSGSGSGGSGTGGTGGLGDGGFDTGAYEESSSEVETIFSEMATRIANIVKKIWDTFKQGWDSVGDYISQGIENLKQAFSNLGTAIKNFLIGAWNNGGEELVYNFGRLAGAITGAMLDIGSQAVNAVAKLFAYLNPETNPYTQAFIKGLNNLLVACQDFALSVGGWFRTFLDNGGQQFLNVIGDICMIIGTTLVNTLATAINWVTRFMNSWAGELLIKGCATALNIAVGSLKAVLIVVEKLTPLWSILVLNFAKNKVIQVLATLFVQLKSKLALLFTPIGKVITSVGNAIVAFKKFSSSVKLAMLALNASKGVSYSVQMFGLLPTVLAKGISAFKIWSASVKGATIAQTAFNVAGSITGGIMAVLTSPITAIVAGVTLLVAIVDKACQYFFNWQGICSWLGEKLGWLWDKVKSFFGWKPDENGIEDELNNDIDLTYDFGTTIEETSDRFGTSCSKINESLASIGIDNNKLALQLDEAQATFEEGFSRISKNAQEYIQAIADGNQDVLDEMSADKDAYIEEYLYAWNNMSQEEKAVAYAKYGEIQGVTDGWLDYTKGTYQDALLAHTAYLENVNNNESLSIQEKDRLIEESTEKFKQAQQDKLSALNITIAEMESAEYQSEEDRYNALRGYYEQRDQLLKDMESYQLGSINTVDDAVKQSADTQSQAYDGVSNSQKQALEEVDSSLETTKGNLSSFKEESDKVASEIPKAWTGIGKTISDEFTNAKNEIVKAFKELNTSISLQSKTLKVNLASAFKGITLDAKTSITNMSTNIKNAFKSMCDTVKQQLNGLSNTVKNSLKVIADTFSSSLDSIKNTTQNKIKQVCDGMVNKVNESKTSIANAFNNIGNGIGNSLDNLNRTVSNKMNTVLNTVKYFVGQLQNATNFTFKTPYMKMPHIQVLGKWDFEKKTTPSFRVNWWSKGGIFPSRTLIGVGDAYQGVGDNAEMVIPLDKFYNELGKQFDKQNRTLSKGNNQPVNITLKLDGREISKATFKNFEELSRLGIIDLSTLI